MFEAKSPGVGFDSDSDSVVTSSKKVLIPEFANSNEPRDLVGFHETTRSTNTLTGERQKRRKLG